MVGITQVNLISTFVLLLILWTDNFEAGNVTKTIRTRRLKSLTNVTNEEALFLTPFITSQKLNDAKNLARVQDLFVFSKSEGEDVPNNITESYSGFLTVNSTFNSNLFFWFVPAVEDKENAPVLLWLNGGPGTTSLVAFFNEHGPYYLDETMKLRSRDVSWVSTHSIIYMDSPVGAGFSFTENEDGYPRFIEDVVRDLYSGLTQFFLIFPEYQSQEFYVAGQSYAGKYAPALAHRIHEGNQDSPKVKINLKGISVGSGFFDPASQLNFADFYYQIGLIDESQKTYFEEQEALTLDLINTGNWSQAFVVLESLIVGYPTPSGISHFERVTGLKYNLNILMEKEPVGNRYFIPFLRQDAIRSALHVGTQKFYKFNPKVYNLMHEDIYQSIKPKFIDLLNWDYKILVYASQFDAIIPYTTVNNFINSLKWKLSDEYSKAVRETWRVGSNNSVAGYKKTVANLNFLVIRNSGHLVAQDQPEWTFEMLNKFTRNEL
ncbi:unnamed protein product [Allacma fusca]|uniref:Carboxypeptidase n=2 Tax=Allacma fusca TaxID=39272 RepID=A0A8J2KH08_9HEXA|nr:unnamed protein product [Allacma fusca]